MPPIVTVFGGSTPREGELAYAAAESLGRRLALAGFDVATGGYMGTMEAVSRGASGEGGLAIGVTSDRIEGWRNASPNRWVGRELRFETQRDRLFQLTQMAAALVALPGGIGTLSEIAFSWSLLQVGEIEARPLILVGEMWKSVFQQFIKLSDGYVPRKDIGLLSFAETEHEVVEQILPLLKENKTGSRSDDGGR